MSYIAYLGKLTYREIPSDNRNKEDNYRFLNEHSRYFSEVVFVHSLIEYK